MSHGVAGAGRQAADAPSGVPRGAPRAPLPRRRAADAAADDDAAAARDARDVRRRQEVLRRAQAFRYGLALADLVSAVLAVLVASAVAGGGLRLSALAASPLVVLAAKLGGLYERDEVVLHHSTLDEVPTLLRHSVLTGVGLWVLEGGDSRPMLGVLCLALLMFAVAGRSLAREAAAAVAPAERCILVGDDAALERLAERLSARDAGIVAFLPLVERRRAQPGEGFDGPWAALDELVVERGAHRILVAPGPHADSEVTLRVISRAKELGAQVSIVPRLLEVVGSSVEFDHVDGLVMLGVHPFGLSRSSQRIKRACDLVFATLALVATAPVLAAIALAIRLESPGPALFRQLRVGREGRTFHMLKFRSMVDGADAERDELAALRGVDTAGLFKLADDPRVTRVGQVLRRFSLDELPQLVNVLRGEMSIVGPRPLIVEEDRRIEGWHRRRLHLTPGMTGPWQVLGDSRRRVPLREMVTIDYLYAANWTLWSDLKILLRTARHVLAGRGV